jgi:hypothetical protein
MAKPQFDDTVYVFPDDANTRVYLNENDARSDDVAGNGEFMPLGNAPEPSDNCEWSANAMRWKISLGEVSFKGLYTVEWEGGNWEMFLDLNDALHCYLGADRDKIENIVLNGAVFEFEGVRFKHNIKLSDAAKNAYLNYVAYRAENDP